MRFPGFQGEWEEKRLKDLGTFFSGGTPKTTNKKYYDGHISFIRSGEINSDTTELRISEEGLKNSSAKMVNKGEVLIALYGATSGEIAISKIYGAINQAILCFDTKENKYFFKNLWQKHIDKILESYLQGGQGNLSGEIIKQLKFRFPSTKEQNKVATFLSLIDERIETQNKIIEDLKKLKASLSKQLFNRKLRFKDENGRDFPKWEDKKLEYTINQFIVPMRDKPQSLVGDIPWCRIEDFNGKYLYTSKSGQGVDINTVKEMNLKIYPTDTLLVSCSANLGVCAITKKELVTNQTFIGLVPDKVKIDVEYLYYIMTLSSIKLNILSSGTTISYLSRKEFEQFKIPYPCLQEQKKIANFLSNIDNKIEVETSTFELQKRQKHYFLQEMFV